MGSRSATAHERLPAVELARLAADIQTLEDAVKEHLPIPTETLASVVTRIARLVIVHTQ